MTPTEEPFDPPIIWVHSDNTHSGRTEQPDQFQSWVQQHPIEAVMILVVAVWLVAIMASWRPIAVRREPPTVFPPPVAPPPPKPPKPQKLPKAKLLK